MTASRLANPRGMEIGSLEHHVARGFIGSTTLSAKDAGDAHGLFGIADGEIVRPQNVFLAVEGHELGSLGLGAHNNLVALHHVGIEAVHC